MSKFTLDLGGADLSNAHFGNRNINASRTIVHGDRIVHNVAGDQVNTTGAARPGCGAQGVPDFTRSPVANQSNPPPAGKFDIKAQNANLQGAQFCDVSEDRSESVVYGKDITHNVSGNQYNHDQPVAQRNADVPASVPTPNASKEEPLQVGGNAPLQIAGNAQGTYAPSMASTFASNGPR